MIVGLAGMAALSYGLADVGGGVGARALGPRRALLRVQFAGLLVVLAVLPIANITMSLSSAVMAAGAGASGLAGTALLFRLMARRPVSVASPLSAVTATALPVAGAACAGERLTSAAWWGVGIGLVAVAVVSWSPGSTEKGTMPTVALALGAGAGFGGYFLLMAEASSAATGFAPLAVARLTAFVLAVAVSLRSSRTRPRRPTRSTRSIAAWLAAAGAADALGDLCFVLATRSHHLALASSVTALYPVIAALAASRVLHERLSWRSGVGLGLSGLTLVLLAG